MSLIKKKIRFKNILVFVLIFDNNSLKTNIFFANGFNQAVKVTNVSILGKAPLRYSMSSNQIQCSPFARYFAIKKGICKCSVRNSARNLCERYVFPLEVRRVNTQFLIV